MKNFFLFLFINEIKSLKDVFTQRGSCVCSYLVSLHPHPSLLFSQQASEDITPVRDCSKLFYSCLFLSVLVCSCLFFSVLVCSFLLLSVLVCSCLFLYVLVCSCMFFSAFVFSCLFLSVLVCSCLFLSVLFCSCQFLSVLVCSCLFLSSVSPWSSLPPALSAILGGQFPQAGIVYNV